MVVILDGEVYCENWCWQWHLIHEQMATKTFIIGAQFCQLWKWPRTLRCPYQVTIDAELFTTSSPQYGASFEPISVRPNIFMIFYGGHKCGYNGEGLGSAAPAQNKMCFHSFESSNSFHIWMVSQSLCGAIWWLDFKALEIGFIIMWFHQFWCFKV